MFISPINFADSHNNIQFKGNTNPEAISKATQAVLRELNIETGTSYVAELLREPQNAQLVESWNNIWKTLKDSIPFADTVEKLELLKTYGISLLRYTQDEMAQFLKFLTSKPTDKDVFFLQTAMDVARNGEIARIEKGKPHFIFDDFEPVLKYVLSGKEERTKKINITNFSKLHIDEHIDHLPYAFCSDIRTTKKDADNIISSINKLLSNKISHSGYEYKYDTYGLNSIKAELDNKYINIDAVRNKDGNPEIIIGYANKEYAGTPVHRQMYILLDKEDKKLSKIKLYIYLKYKNKQGDAKISDIFDSKYYESQKRAFRKLFGHDFNSYDSPFQEQLPLWLRYGYDNSKYMLKEIEYDVKTGIAELKHYAGGSIHYPQKYRLVDKYSDKLGIMVDENNPISFMPIEPTNYDLEQMINNEKTNNLLKVLNLSGFKDCFMRIISEISHV